MLRNLNYSDTAVMTCFQIFFFFGVFVETSWPGASVWAFPMAAVDWYPRAGVAMNSLQTSIHDVLSPFPCQAHLGYLLWWLNHPNSSQHLGGAIVLLSFCSALGKWELVRPIDQNVLIPGCEIQTLLHHAPQHPLQMYKVPFNVCVWSLPITWLTWNDTLATFRELN